MWLNVYNNRKIGKNLISKRKEENLITNKTKQENYKKLNIL